MYGIFTYIYHKNQPNVVKYTIHGSYGTMGMDSSSWTSCFCFCRNQVIKIDTVDEPPGMYKTL